MVTYLSGTKHNRVELIQELHESIIGCLQATTNNHLTWNSCITKTDNPGVDKELIQTGKR